ncbi:MAG: tetratricopeptide repeat protein [Chitinivibrionales bacterium]|nr:tetratricopeptide repeat protein [Chitinivibrionales bacterium]
MPKRKTAFREPKEKDVLEELCNSVINFSRPFEDVKELIEEKAFEAIENDLSENALRHLQRLASFFEELENKNDEICSDQAQVYSLIGEILHYTNKFSESIHWFRKSVVVDDRNAAFYAGLAASYEKLGDTDRAIRSLEQEIRLNPGDYSPYLHLADIYDRLENYEKASECLEKLLERDPDNIQALHKLICYHQTHLPNANVEFLRRRLLSCHKELAKTDLVIWTFHICCERKYNYAIRILSAKEFEQSSDPMVNLLKAYVYYEQGKQDEQMDELSEFARKNRRKKTAMQVQYDQFMTVFGELALSKIKPS